MGIRIITGQPGNGKTLYMLSLLMHAIDENNRSIEQGKPARPIIAFGIDGLQPGLCEVRQDASDWQSCPDGSLIFVDEAWKDFGHLHDARQKPTPAYVLALAEHRHRGVDFVMTTQMANQLYPFMRGLVGGAGGGHTHVARHFGMSLCTIYNWPELQEDTKSPTARERAVSEKWIQPSKLFALYKSATIHTVKRSLPWKLVLIPASLVLFVVLLFTGWRSYQGFIAQQQGKAADGVAVAADLPGEREPESKGPRTAQEWATWLTPVLPGIPFTAPAFAGQKPVAKPRNFCMISGDDFRDPGATVCRCMTEQGTRPAGITNALCRSLAMNGYYDPFLAPPSPATGTSTSSSSSGTSSRPQVQSLPGVSRQVGENYAPPGFDP